MISEPSSAVMADFSQPPKLTHEELVRTLCKPGQDIISSLDPQRAHLWHMASKLCSESGELMDAIGKLVIYNKPLDLPNVIEELGDMEFYMQGIRSALQLTRQQTLDHNIDKLCTRYTGAKYSDQAAQERKDKQSE